MKRFLNFRINGRAQTPEYPIYPAKLKEPYRTSRFEVGEQLYGSIELKDQILKQG